MTSFSNLSGTKFFITRLFEHLYTRDLPQSTKQISSLSKQLLISVQSFHKCFLFTHSINFRKINCQGGNTVKLERPRQKTLIENFEIFSRFFEQFLTRIYFDCTNNEQMFTNVSETHCIEKSMLA